MDAIPQRPAVARGYRALLDFLERFLRLPRINPSWWSLLGLLASAACLFTAQRIGWTLALVGVAVITDWLDGATARAHDAVTREGYLIDDAIDRFSEGFIFAAAATVSAVGRIFFLLWLLNVALTIWSVAHTKHRILPLRFAYLIVLGLQLALG